MQTEAIRQLFAAIAAHGGTVVIDRSYAERLAQAHIALDGRGTFVGSDFSADFALSLGGDGTLLRTAKRVGRRSIPIIGVNMGRMGYLADIMPTEIAAAIESIYAAHYTIVRHALLAVAVNGVLLPDDSYALNDVAVLKRDTASMIRIRVSVNGEFLATYSADGLIVSTPTGSTAYNLANGGPIIAPTTRTLCLTAVAPHSLNLRPMVIDDDSVVSLTVESRSKNFLLAVDGRSTTLQQGAEIAVQKASHTIAMVQLPTKHYYETLREKLMWGADMRKQ